MLDEVNLRNEEDLAAAVHPGDAVHVLSNPDPQLPAAADRKPTFLYLVSALAGGNLVSSMLRIAGGLLQARYAAPDVLGLFNGIGLVQGYTRFLQLGVLNGLNRELPYYYGKGDQKRVRELASVALAWSLMLGTVLALALCGIAGWCFMRGDRWMAAGWIANAVLAFQFFYGSMYLQATYRTASDFARLSLTNVIQNALAVVFVALVAVMNFYGLCLRAILVAIAAALMLHAWRPIRVFPTWNWRDWLHLLVIGLPIFVVGELTQFWTTLEGTFVFDILGRRDMGFYAMVVVAGTTLEMLPLAVSQVIYPRMAEEYGRTHEIGGVLRMTLKPMLLTLAGMVPVVFLGWWLARPVTEFFIPRYAGAVPAMQWALLPPVLSSLFPIHNVFNVVRRQDLDVIGTLIGMLGYFHALTYLFANDASVSTFPQAMLIGRGIHLTACYLLLIPLAFHRKPNVPAPLG
jgi:O-antigen/teichoic acid export membrane protein